MTYDYTCDKCKSTIEIRHSIHNDSPIKCKKCKSKMRREIGMGICVISKSGGLEKAKAKEHTKKVKDKERAVHMRKKAFGSAAVGDPVDKPDPMHLVKRGKTIGGQQKEVDKADFVKAAAKDPLMVHKAQESLKKRKNAS